MFLQERINVLVQLGQHLQGQDDYLQAILKRTAFNNAWFTVENQEKALHTIATQFLDADKLNTWLKKYDFSKNSSPKSIGLILTDNLPLENFYEWMCIFLAGHKTLLKLAEKDKFLYPYLIKLLERFHPNAKNYFQIIPFLKNMDAIIARNIPRSNRYFETYFKKIPHLIQPKRVSIAVLDGKETREELLALGKDIFDYFGLGSRSTSKVYLPKNYKFEPLLEALHEYRQIVLHTSYKNNFDYSYALFMLNKTPYKANGCILLTENEGLQSGIANLFYEYYSDIKEMEEKLNQHRDDIEVVVSHCALPDWNVVEFGKAQTPQLETSENVLSFLLKI